MIGKVLVRPTECPIKGGSRESASRARYSVASTHRRRPRRNRVNSGVFV